MLLGKNGFVWTLCLVILIATTSCSNTMNGVGQDIESAGQKIQKTF